ncbi:hypothetical protein ACWD7T_13065 [Streptomyces sp. 900116325]|uniref:hypothetical protein n=1 Tax=Streptomyces sp. NPDC005525 TaxID=3364720 RepID=UPI00367EB3B1
MTTTLTGLPFQRCQTVENGIRVLYSNRDFIDQNGSHEPVPHKSIMPLRRKDLGDGAVDQAIMRDDRPRRPGRRSIDAEFRCRGFTR